MKTENLKGREGGREGANALQDVLIEGGRDGYSVCKNKSDEVINGFNDVEDKHLKHGKGVP